MKKSLSLFLVLMFVFTLFPTSIIATASSDSDIYTEFSEYLVYSGSSSDEYVTTSYDINTFVKGETNNETAAVLYVINHKMPRVGTEGDIPIITDLLNDGYIVTVLDYKNSDEAISPNLDWSILETSNQIREYKLIGGNTFKSDNLFIVPAGYRIAKDITYFELDKHAPNGTIDYILDVWNTYYAGIKKDANGNLLPTATTIDECIKPDGTPIQLDLKLDVVYPSKPKEVIPVFMLASSAETTLSSTLRRPAYTGFIMNGYAGVVYDHEYIPMSRNDHYGYFDKAFSLYKYTANRSHSAAVRCVRDIADQFGFNANHIGVWGFSKSSFGPALLSSVNHIEKGELDTLDDYCDVSEDPNESPEAQPWLTDENGKELSSNVSVVYSGSGPGLCYSKDFTISEDSVPIASSIGTIDEVGGFNNFINPVSNFLDDMPIQSLFLSIEGIDHTYPNGYDPIREIDTYKTYFDYLDNNIRAEYRQEPPKILWVTPIDKSVHPTTVVPIEIKFARAMYAESVKNGVKVIDEATNKEVDGVWEILHNNTTFRFNASTLNVASKYRIEITKECISIDGVAISENMIKRFRILGSESLNVTKDAYIENGVNADANFGSENSLKVFNSDDVIQKSYMGFERDGGFGDVSKATLLLKGSSDSNYRNDIFGILDDSWNENEITWNNAPANDELTSEFVAEGVYGGEKLNSFTSNRIINAIDVTEYVKNLDGNTATFAIASTLKNASVLNYDFDDVENFEFGTDYRWGGGNATATIIDMETPTGSKALEFGDRAYNYTRMKLQNCFKPTALTTDDIGKVYKATMYVKPIKDCIFNLGVYAQSNGTYSTVSFDSKDFGVYADRWNKIEYEFEVKEDMVEDNIQFIGLQTDVVVNTLYLADIKVTLEANSNEIISKEGSSSVYPNARLVLDTNENLANIDGNNTYVESGKKIDTNNSSETNIYVKGADKNHTSGMQKGYMLMPLDNVDTANTVNLKFNFVNTAKQSISVYGVDADYLNISPETLSDKEFSSAEMWDNTITWNSAIGNDKNGAGVLSDFAYNNAPLATIDASVAGEKSIDVTAFVKMLKTQGAKNATFVFVANNQNITKTIDFESDISKYGITLSHGVSSYEVVEGGKDGTGHALQFKRTASSATGYYESISIQNLIDDNNLWSEDDIGKTFKVSFWAKAENATPEKYKNTIVASIAANKAFTYTAILGAGNDKVKAKELGVNLESKGNAEQVWKEFELNFTITADMIADDTNKKRSNLVISGFSTVKNIWLDDIKCEIVAESAEISGGIGLIKEYTFDEADANLKGFKLTQADKAEISIHPTGGKNGTAALLFEKTVADYNPTISIPYLINSNNTYTADDIGKTYSITFDYCAEQNTGGNATVLYKMAGLGSGNGSGFALGDSVYDKKVSATGDWVTKNFTFTITEDMVNTTPLRTCVVIGSYGSTQKVYIDNVKSIVISQGPYLEVNGETTTQNNAAVISTIKSDSPNEAFSIPPFELKREDYVENAINSKKAYLSYDVNNASDVKTAKLTLDILSNPLSDAQTVDVYALKNANFDASTITYSNAPGNNPLTNAVINSFMFGNTKLANIEAKNGEYEIDATDYVKSLEADEKAVFVVTTEDQPNEIVYDNNFEDGFSLNTFRDLRYGGQSDIFPKLITESNQNKCLELSNIKYSYSRARFVNTFGKPFFTDSDIGTKYKVSFKIKPEIDVKILTGIMSSYPNRTYATGSSSATNLQKSGGYLNYRDAKANVWNDMEFIYTVNSDSVLGSVNALSIEQSTTFSSVLCVDDIKVEKLSGANDVVLSKSSDLTVDYNVIDTTQNNVQISAINCSGTFNKGDSINVNIDTSSSFDKSVTDVKFYINDVLDNSKYIKNGSNYIFKMINLQPGSYTVYADVTFSDGETLTTVPETFDISDNVSYTDIMTIIDGMIETGSTVSIKKSIKNNLSKDVSGIMLFVIYDQTDSIVAINKCDSQVIGAGSVKDFNLTVELPTIPDGAYAKIMVWSDLDSMLPYIQPLVLD